MCKSKLGETKFNVGDVVFCASFEYVVDKYYPSKFDIDTGIETLGKTVYAEKYDITEGLIVAKRENEYMVANVWVAKENVFKTRKQAEIGIEEMEGE